MSTRTTTGPRIADPPEAWVDLHGDYLFRFAVRRVGEAAAAEDLVQDTLLAALERVETFDGRAEFRTWLTAILRHKIADCYRQKARGSGSAGGPSGAHGKAPVDVAADEEEGDLESCDAFDARTESLFNRFGKWSRSPGRLGPWPVDGEEHEELARSLTGCLGKLPGPVAELFVLHEHRGMPADHLARAQGITVSNLWVRLYRARLALRDCLERRGFTRGAR